MDVAEIQEAVTDELKKVQKEEFLTAFQKLYNRAKACIYANGAYFELKKKYMSAVFKKISPNTFRLHCIYAWLKENVDVIFAVPEVIHSN